jgi:hypothetical protein
VKKGVDSGHGVSELATGSPSTMRLKEEGFEAVGTTGSGSIGYSSEVSDVS